MTVNMTPAEPLPVAVALFVDVWKRYDLRTEIAGSLSCVEAQALASVFKAAGSPEDGRAWLQAHVDADGECECPRAAVADDDEDPEARPCEGCGADAGEPCIGSGPCEETPAPVRGVGMGIAELEALRDAQSVHVFHGWFGSRPEGLRGTVESVGSIADPDVVIVRSVGGDIRRYWNRRTMSVG